VSARSEAIPSCPCDAPAIDWHAWLAIALLTVFVWIFFLAENPPYTVW
jgi:hypothetical protein